MKRPLLDALAQHLGADWTSALETTWSEAYDTIVQLMLGEEAER